MALEPATAAQRIVGYAGTASDGLTQLDAAHWPLHSLHGRAQRAHRRHRRRHPARPLDHPRPRLRRRPPAHAHTAPASLHTGFEDVAGTTNTAVGTAMTPACVAPQARPPPAQYYQRSNVVKASEDKTFPGAIAAVASPVGPGGQRR